MLAQIQEVNEDGFGPFETFVPMNLKRLELRVNGLNFKPSFKKTSSMGIKQSDNPDFSVTH